MGRLKQIRNVRLHHEGTKTLIYSLIGLALCNVCAYLLFPTTAFCVIISLSATLYILLINFFQCPIRRFECDDTTGVIVAPADGHIVVIEEVDEQEYFHDRRLMISIFMSITNVHANWFPCDGVVTKVEHQNGRFQAAWLPKASTENERSMVVIQTPEGVEVMARQIAGAMARRIVTYAKVGDECYIDDHMGFIKLGSRVDVYLPLGTEVNVKMNQKTIGNQTIIARLKTE